MHRSGTSAVTRALVDLGVVLGNDLMPAVEGNNPTGFWENMGIYRRSENLLHTLGRSWHSVSLIEPWRWQIPEVRAAQADMVQFLRDTFGNAPLWGFKDPRTCRLLPFWKPVLAEFGSKPCYLIVLRNPLSVAQSLAKRDGLPEEQSHLLWLEHMVEAMCESAGATRVVVDYDNLMQSPTREMKRIAQVFGLRREPQSAATDRVFEKGFLRQELRHTRFDAKDLVGHPAVSRLVALVYQSLRSLAESPIVPEDSLASDVWNAARRELEDIAPFLNGFESAVKRADEEARRLDSAHAIVAAREEEIASLKDTVVKLEGDINNLNTTVTGQEQQISALQGRVSEHAGRAQMLEKSLEAVQTELGAVYASKSWRITAPLRAMRRTVSRTADHPGPRRGGGTLARRVYAGLPISMPAKMRLKSILFTAFPWLFSRSGAYKRWIAFREALLKENDSKTMAPPVATATAQADEIYMAEEENRFVPLAEGTRVSSSIKLIAFYLPQFHPIPENDDWWGKGFTEWTNVTRARPQFVGHYQPRLPGELGFYDLRLKEVQKRQIELARMYGIHGFCYHHYWFGGKRLLERPLNQVLANPDLDFPFCVCWANENWTRRWDGRDTEILISQQYSPADDLAFIKDLDPILRDPRYIRVDGKPLLAVYRPGLLPDAKATAARWRRYCIEAGIGELFLCSTTSFENADPLSYGFDAAIEFPPNNQPPPVIINRVRLLNQQFGGMICDYGEMVERSRSWSKPSFRVFPGVMPSWDNEARRPGKGTIFAYSSPEAYAEWLENACQRAAETLEPEQRLVFVNAWNEWAEGAYLEPDRRYGYAYLQATSDVLRRFPEAGRRRIVYVSHDAHLHGAQMLSVHIVKALHERFGYEVDVILYGPGPLVSNFLRYARVHEFWQGGSSHAHRSEIVAALRRDGAKAAIISTSVIGDAVELLKNAGFTAITLVHELPQVIRSGGFEDSLRKVAELSDRIVFPARVVYDRLSELVAFDPAKTCVRPQGYFHHSAYRKNKAHARRSVRDELGLPQGAEIVLAMAYGDRRKGLDLFVDVALATLRRPNTYFVWIGNLEPVTFAPLEKRIRAASAAPRVLFPGERKSPEIYFAAADVYLLPSREDPFPSVALAAMDTGTPIIGFQGAGGFCELLDRGAGVLVPYEDTEAMAAAVTGLLDHPASGIEMGTVGARIVDDQFRFVDYMHFLLEEVGEPQFKVSVIVPNFNYERYLQQRLSSIQRQTVKPYEIIFLDDCSADRSLSEAERLLSDCGIEYRIVPNQQNQGTFRQWLKGLELARGDIVWIAEADDHCAENFIESLLPAFIDPDVRLAYCQSKQIDEEGRILAQGYFDYTRDVSPTKWLAPYSRSGTEEIRDTLFIKNTIPNSSAVLMRRPDLDSLRESLGGLKVAGDWMTYVQVLARGHVWFQPEPLNFHRRHNQAATRRFAQDGLALFREILSVQTYIADRYDVPAEAKAKRDAYLQVLYEEFGLHQQGPKCFIEHPELHALYSGLTVGAKTRVLPVRDAGVSRDSAIRKG